MLYPARKKDLDKTLGSFACSSFDHGVYSDIFYCPDCKNGFLSKIQALPISELKQESQNQYESVVDEAYLKHLDSRHKTYREFLKTHSSFFKGKKILEVGCYYGGFYDIVKDQVASYTGLEPSIHACQYLKKKNTEIDLIQGPIEVLHQRLLLDDSLKEKFDTIVLFDVIEHLPDPVESLRVLHHFLKPNGSILFSTINIESTFSILLGPFWPWFMDMHYYYFSDRGYQNMLYRSGYVQKDHEHFPYIVSFHYFVLKVLSLLGIRLKSVWKWIPDFDLPIRLGDTVLIIGSKTKY